MTLNERELSILECVIRDYIETAEPVSSERVSNKIRFAISPATVRSAMLKLDEEGLLEQPHISAGRVPTDNAYRYFVDHMIKHSGGSRVTAFKKYIENDIGDDSDMWQSFVEALAEHLGLFTVLAHDDGDHRVFSAGIQQVFAEPEFEERGVIKSFIEIIDETPYLYRHYRSFQKHDPQVFIGKENPISAALHFSSVVARPYPSLFVLAFGPKRMDYEEVTSFFKELIG